MTSRQARKILNAGTETRPNQRYRQRTVTAALGVYRRAAHRLQRWHRLRWRDFHWSASAKTWRWAWQLRCSARIQGIPPGRRAWLRACVKRDEACAAYLAKGGRRRTEIFGRSVVEALNPYLQRQLARKR
jgi:hypothetical protein